MLNVPQSMELADGTAACDVETVFTPFVNEALHVPEVSSTSGTTTPAVKVKDAGSQPSNVMKGLAGLLGLALGGSVGLDVLVPGGVAVADGAEVAGVVAVPGAVVGGDELAGVLVGSAPSPYVSQMMNPIKAMKPNPAMDHRIRKIHCRALLVPTVNIIPGSWSVP
jgi:hypothetical protein